MININDIDPSKKCFKVCNQDIIVVDDDDNDHQTLRNVMTASAKIIPNEDRSFMIFDFGAIMAQYIRLRKLIPRAFPFYAIKSMSDKQIISLLGSLGAGFDCASWGEIYNASMAIPKSNGTFPEKYHSLNSEKIIFSHPFKFPKEMVKASKIGVEFSVFDTEEELYAISDNWPNVKVLLRIALPKKFKAYAQLGKKFGAPKCDMNKLISLAKELKLNLVGVCFHVGSGVEESNPWSQCIEYSAQIFRMMEQCGFKPYLLDIGGGFPFMSMITSEINSTKQTEFEQECSNINRVLDKYFPSQDNYVIICEPGSYFTNGSGCIFCQVIGKVEENICVNQLNAVKEEFPKTKYSYVLNNSIYHTVELESSFEIYSLKDFIRNEQIVHLKNDTQNNAKITSRFLGFTVDEFDCMISEIEIPELSVNDWIVMADKGAYSDVHNELSTMFCSTTAIPHYYCISKRNLSLLRSLIDSCNGVRKSSLKSADRKGVLNSVFSTCSLM